ncbi:MAG: hypothetical protein ACXIUO_09385 [Erythrobacter sp.]
MLDLGISLSTTLLSRRSFLLGAAGLPALLLAGLGTTGVTKGFTALPRVSGYTATAGRFRRTPTGFVRCAANEERLCFDSAGRFVGQAMEGPETYYSAAWDDPDAPNGSSDFAYLNGDQAFIDYAGEHNEPDIFGGTGGGVVITSNVANQFHNTTALQATGIVAGDVIRYEAIVAITGATVPGRIDIRGGGNPSFAFSFAHNAAGEITGMITLFGSTQTFDAEFRDLGTINSKRWYHLIVWRRATGTANAQIGLGFGTAAADVGKKLHFCDLRMVHKPQCAPSSWPVCAPNKTFAADTLETSFQGNIGALFYGGAGRCRTLITDGAIALIPDSYRRHDGFSMVTQIGILNSTESADRVGLMPYPNMEREFAFWGGGNRTILFGPARFAVDMNSNANPASFTNLTVSNAFTQNLLLRGWMDGRFILSSSQVTGNLTFDDMLLFPTCSTLADHFEQVDIGLEDLHLIDTAGPSVSIQRALVMSHPSSHSRARFQVQADDDLTSNQVYMGRMIVRGHRVAGISLNISDSSFQNMGRAVETTLVGANQLTRPYVVTADRVFYYQNWSDSFYIGHGNYAGSSFDNQFHGGFTSRYTTLLNTRRETEVDIGSGWQPLSATALTENDLPIGRIARHIGDYNFNTETLDTSTADPDRTIIVRSWNKGSTSSDFFDKPGFQFHTTEIDEGTYTRQPRMGETFVIEQIDPPSPTTPHVRLFCDWGRWSTATTFVNAGVAPAQGNTGTHADVFQTILFNIRLDDISCDGMFTCGDAQGPFIQGNNSTALWGKMDFTNFIGLVATNNAFYGFGGANTLTPDITLADSLIMPAWSPTRDINGNSQMGAAIRATSAPLVFNLDNVWLGTRNALSPVGENGGVINGTTNNVRMRRLNNFDLWQTSIGTGPDGDTFIPEEFREPQSGYADPILIGNPVETGFRFTEAAEIATGLPLNATLEASLVTGEFFKPLTDWLRPWQRDQDFIVNVSNTAAIGTKLDVRQYQRFRPEANLPAGVVQGTSLEPRYGNPRPGLFGFDADGDLAVIGSLAGINKLFLLKTDADELILVDVRG